jgi:hypothetical protein
VMPRISRPAGWEWGFGCSIASISPEQNAKEFRNVLVEQEQQGFSQ